MKKNYLWIHAFLINPILNLMAFYYTDVFYENQTHIGNALHHPLYFWIWTLSSCFGYYYYTKKIWDIYSISYSKWLHAFFNVSIIISICIPYSPDLPGWINDGHVWLAILGVSGYMFEWIWISLHTTLQYEKEWKYLLSIFFLCLFFLFYFGHVTSFAEILFSTLVNSYTCFWLTKIMQK